MLAEFKSSVSFILIATSGWTVLRQFSIANCLALPFNKIMN